MAGGVLALGQETAAGAFESGEALGQLVEYRLELGLDVLKLLEPLVALLGHALQDDGLEALGDVGVALSGANGGVVDDRVHQRAEALPSEGDDPGEPLVEDHAEGVDIAGLVGGAGVDELLGGHVGVGAHARGGRCEPGADAVGLGETEVGDLDGALTGNHQVAGLHISVDDAIAGARG